MLLPLASSLSPLGRAGAAAPAINVASQANGGVTSASSTVNANFPIAAINNGSRALSPAWGSGGGWNDGTNGVFPDWAQIDFSGSKTINRIVVVTLRNDFSNSAEPTVSTSASSYGVKDFLLQYWDGATWQTLQTVAGNNLVIRDFSFSPVTTTKVRIWITASNDNSYSRLVELEAWGN